MNNLKFINSKKNKQLFLSLLYHEVYREGKESESVREKITQL